MNVAFQLRRRPAALPASAALYPTRDAAPPLALCAAMALDPAGRIHAVGRGLLLRLPAPTERALPGAVRLREIAPHLLLPVDAELVPALLDDEAAGMVRDRGLVFLPDGRALAYDPRAPLALAALLAMPTTQARPWAPLPDRPALADRIESIEVDRPEDTPDSILDAGDGAEIGSEAGDPTEPGADAGAASGKKGWGRWWRRAKQAAAGAGAMAGASALPGANVVARQAAALRDLLRQFREGDIEKALRRALPLSEPGGPRGAGAYTGDQLPERDFTYRLDDLLGDRPTAPSGGRWLGGDADLYAQLLREYRKAAEEAVRRGDYRRAAAIHGKLLRDDRAAVAALMQGGLYHDAGVLLLARLDDRRGAARAFEAAGEYDRAVALYREVADHEAAGDLLRRIGEDEAAVGEYLIAADRLIAGGGGHLAAGDLLRDKAGRPDLALAQYVAGWALHPAANAVSCGLRVARHRAEAGDAAALRSLLDEADAFFAGAADAREPGRFYNEIAALAGSPRLAEACDDLRDRALLGLAAQMRHQARRGVRTTGLVGSLIGSSPHWAAPVVSDATHAVASVGRPRDRSTATAHAASRLRVGSGVVRAVAGAPETGDIFVGFERGEVYAFQQETSEVVLIAAYDLPVAALAADPCGTRLVVLRSHPAGRGVVSSYARQPNGRYKLLAGTTLDQVFDPWLTPVLDDHLECLVGLWGGLGFHVLSVDSFASWGFFSLPGPDANRPAGLLLNADGDGGGFSIVAHDGRQWCLLEPRGEAIRPTGLSWSPAPPPNPLRVTPLGCARIAPGIVDLAGLGAGGSLHWGRLDGGDAIARNHKAARHGDQPYRAVALVRDGLLAAVRETGVDWLRCSTSAFQAWRTTEEALPGAVAAFASKPTGELIVVLADGTVVRQPVPA